MTVPDAQQRQAVMMDMATMKRLNLRLSHIDHFDAPNHRHHRHQRLSTARMESCPQR